MISGEILQMTNPVLTELNRIPKGQRFVRTLMEIVGLKGHEGGLCFGIICMAIQTFFSGQFEIFIQLIKLLARISPSDFQQSVNTIKKERIQLVKEAKMNICKQLAEEYKLELNPDRLWSTTLSSEEIAKISFLKNIKGNNDELNAQFRAMISKKINHEADLRNKNLLADQILPFLEGVEGYLMSRRYKHLFPPEMQVEDQNFLQTLPIFAPGNFESDNMMSLNSVFGIYEEDELKYYFSSLFSAFAEYKGRAVFDLQNIGHDIALFFDSENIPKWRLLNPSHMPISDILAKEQLGQSVLDEFASVNLALQLKIYIHKKDEEIFSRYLAQWKSNDAWQKMHAVNEKRLQMLDSNGASLLMLAVSNNAYSLVEKLLEAKANPEDRHYKGLSPLYVAAQNGNIDLINLLRKYNASLEAFADTEYGGSSLHIAANEGQIETVKYLLQAKVDPNIESKKGFTPLHAVAECGRLDVVNVLIEAKANVNHLSRNNRSVLYKAAQEGYTDIVKTLIDAKANCDNVTDDGATALFMAAQEGYTEIVKLLLKAKANIKIPFKNKTPLSVAIEEGHTEIVRILKKQCLHTNENHFWYKATHATVVDLNPSTRDSIKVKYGLSAIS